MRKSFILVAAAVLCSALPLSAQFVGGGATPSPSIGSNSSVAEGRTFSITYAPTTFEYTSGNSSSSNDDFKTVSVNWGTISALSSSSLPLYYEFGWGADLSFYFDSGSDYGIDYDTKSFLLAVKVPVSIMTPINLTPEITLYPYAGVHAKGFVLGKSISNVEYNGSSEKSTADMFSKDDMGDGRYKRLGFGYQAGVRVVFGSYFASVGIENALSEISKNTKMNLVTISLGIML